MEHNSAQKKWFIYVGDHHDGPLSVSDIQTGIAEGKYSRDSFVWCQGMVDWQPLSQVPEFLPNLAASSQPVRKPIAPVSVEGPSRAEVQEPAVTLFAASASEAKSEAPLAAAPKSSLRRISWPQFSLRGKGPRILLSALISLIVVVLLLQLPPAAPVREKLMSLVQPLPELPQIDPADEKLFREVAETPLSQGARVAVALSRDDVLSPVFYLATNLPTGTVFELVLEGIPQTLLNTLHFTQTVEIPTERRLGRSDPIRYPDGKLVPRGQYRVYVVEKRAGQPEAAMKALAQAPISTIALPAYLPQDRKAVFAKEFFLGSRDQTYPTRLKEYHAKVLQKASQELGELRQLHTMLDSQFTATVAHFDRLAQQKTSKKTMPAWRDFSATWKRIDAQTQGTLLTLSPEMLKQEYFYGPVYKLAQAAARSVSELNTLQGDWLNRRGANETAVPEAITLGQSVSERSLLELKNQLEFLEKNPVDANGLPTLLPRESL